MHQLEPDEHEVIRSKKMPGRLTEACLVPGRELLLLVRRTTDRQPCDNLDSQGVLKMELLPRNPAYPEALGMPGCRGLMSMSESAASLALVKQLWPYWNAVG